MGRLGQDFKYTVRTVLDRRSSVLVQRVIRKAIRWSTGADVPGTLNCR